MLRNAVNPDPPLVFDETLVKRLKRLQLRLEQRGPIFLWLSSVSISDVVSRPEQILGPPYGPLAQLVEHRTFNPLVEGSNPSWPTHLTKNCLVRRDSLGEKKVHCEK